MVKDSDRMTADVAEIFSSIQGEGPFMGIKQIFIRFAQCNLHCKFCDQKTAFGPKHFTVDKMLSIIKQTNENSGGHHSVSLTGGEPLMYKDFLVSLLPPLRETNMQIYLETNGTLPEHLEAVIDLVDIVAMDFKLPSSTGQGEFWREHREFLDIAHTRKCFVKTVVTNETTAADIERTINIIHDIDREILFVLQPVWPVEGIDRAKAGLLLDYLFLAEKKLANVRVMPQMHKVLGVK